MANRQLPNQVKSMRDDLISQGFLDDQFIQVEDLQDDESPSFAEEVAALYFKDSAKVLIVMEAALEKKPVDYSALDQLIHRLKGSSSSMGAAKVMQETLAFRDLCRERNADGCKEAFQRLKTEFETLKPKLQTYFQLARQARPAETADRPA
ncbi:hypothetical protein AQUCO_00100254v1 [Aquilegia coerulea]|uniref:Histidine-containing phosphotransfer protein n=1 Tax=Aquilegia coerulea TaxID=218851 RepID=A0A2G5F9I9_AQUCA|nr:hypothetical protein AQUCO_00100254v1 [Aquilegia coerulea]